MSVMEEPPLFPLIFSVNFLVNWFPWWEGGGYPPFPLRKNLLKICPKTVFLGKKRRFRRKNSKPLSVMGGVPPFSVIFFPLTFWPAAFPDGGEGEVPPSRTFFVTGVFEPFPYLSSLSLPLSSFSSSMSCHLLILVTYRVSLKKGNRN